MRSNSLINFLKEYWNYNLYRNLLFLDSKTGKSSLNFEYKPNRQNQEQKFVEEIIKRRNKNHIYTSCTMFKDLETIIQSNNKKHWNNIDPLRLSDRLFFDFDYKNDEVKRIMELQKKAVQEKDNNTFVNSQKQLQSEIFDNDLLKKPYDEMKIVYNYFKETWGIKPFCVFSGSAGFHINILFEPYNLPNISDIAEKYIIDLFRKQKGLKLIDENVKDLLKRKQRIPYSINHKSNLMCVPIQKTTYEDVLEQIEKQQKHKEKVYKLKPVPFKFQEYQAPNSFLGNLLLMDRKAKENKKLRDEQKQLQIKERARTIKRGVYSKNNNFNLRKIVRSLETPEYSNSDLDLYQCPLPGHVDNNPSFSCYDNYYICSCGKGNYYDFISNYFSTTKHEEIMKLARKYNQ